MCTIMKKFKYLFLAIMANVIVACNTNDPKQSIYTGNVVGTLGCYDEATRTIFYKGYFVATSDNDTVLSFNLDVKDSIDVRYGNYAISPIKIPYSFTITILEPSDKQYIHYAIPIEDAMHQPVTKPLNEIKQVTINPWKQ